MKKILFSLVAVVACLALRSPAASVGPTGYSADFSTRPVVADWSTRSIAGGANGAADATNSVMVDTNLAVIAASSITAQVLNFDPTNPPANNALASWTSGGGAYLQTRPTNVRITLLMATLVNNTGSNVDTINISYALNVTTAGLEEVPGQRVYYSLTGAAGSWLNIAAPQASGAVTATINTTWLDGGSLYVLIADDNGTVAPDTACQIDGFTVTTSGGGPATTAINITSPTEAQNIVENVNFAVNATTSGGITGTDFYLDGNLVGSDATPPYSVTYSNVALGPHVLLAVANGSINSTAVNINIVANNPPTVAVTSAPGGTVLVGSNIINTATVTDTDPGGSIRRVEFYVDGELTPRFTDTTSPYNFHLGDVLAGPHTITAIAVDHSNARGTNSNTLTATNPASVSIIIPNGSTWKYLDKGTDQGDGGVPWAGLAFDDSGWSNGVAELGYGDTANNRPETTLIGFGPNATTKFATTYFRKSFNVANPASITNLIVRLLRDDAGIVYINGTEVFRSALTNLPPITYQTYSGTAVNDDGTFYQVTNVNPSVLVSGLNVVAVELHQDTAGSSDISFDLMLWAQPAGPSVSIALNLDGSVTLTWPGSGSLVCTDDPGLPRSSWSVVAGATSGYNIAAGSQAAYRFYAIVEP